MDAESFERVHDSFQQFHAFFARLYAKVRKSKKTG